VEKKKIPRLSLLLLIILCIGIGIVFLLRPALLSKKAEKASSSFSTMEEALAHHSLIPSQHSQSCKQCHQQAYEQWEHSQHAWANRLLDPQKDVAAFSQATKLTHGASTFEPQIHENDFELVVTDAQGKTEHFQALAVIGVEPLLQYLVALPGGRLQVFDWAFDTLKKEWFYVFGEEMREAHEWGYWKNRGMNWNSRCASCHMTDFKKGYDVATDSYHSTWKEMGISCLQCHGTMEGHPGDAQKNTPSKNLSAQQIMDSCGSCHARREELDGNFKTGDAFSDHYRLILPDTPGIFYPDGQVHEEDFEYASFLLSRMGNKGVTCLDCHNPHSGKLKLPVENNQLCLSCHTPPGIRGAIPIEVLAHSHHPEGSAGNRCVECHMPTTVYMQRDARRDHGFTIPDPLLTKELGIPNSCNRCHSDKSTDWALKWVNQWYGKNMDRHSRDRARVIAAAQNQNPEILPSLLEMAHSEETPAWKASLVALLAPWASRAEVKKILAESLQDSSPLVRSAALRAMEGLTDPQDAFSSLLHDPTRLVRLDASWIWANRTDLHSGDDRELLDYLNFNSDQPEGALRQGELALNNHRLIEAESWIRKAVAWDQSSAYIQDFFGTVLNLLGKNEEADLTFRQAIKLDPKNPEYVYHLALLSAELGHTEETIENLKIAVRLDPQWGRAWYNLGLVYAQRNQLENALEALKKSETLMPESTDAPYALATIYLRKQDKVRAKAALLKTLQIQPNHPEALNLMKQIEN
jgi:predicted CXXCH cytochrome family protein